MSELTERIAKLASYKVTKPIVKTIPEEEYKE